MNVFVLTTGRSGSVTFARAAYHITNYTSGHETRLREVGASRLSYPENHIEADNRLSWFLGRLDETYGTEAFYVHLVRDREATAKSFDRRWGSPRSIIQSYAQGFLDAEPGGIELCRDLWDTVNANIRLFLKDKPRRMEMHLEAVKAEFPRFWAAIGAEGDLDAALAEWDVRHNSSAEREAKMDGKGVTGRIRTLLAGR